MHNGSLLSWAFSMEEIIWAACEFRHPPVANYPTVELAGLKEMTQDLADLLGLAIPVSCRKRAHQGTWHQPHQGHTSQPLPGVPLILR
jgi:hypothetical protein